MVPNQPVKGNTTPYSENKIKLEVIKATECFSKVRFQWFDFNRIKIDSGKKLCTMTRNDIVSDNVRNNPRSKNKILSIVFNSKLYFEDHINNLCKKAS